MRGIGSRVRRSVVKELILRERASVVYLQETKLATISVFCANEILGTDFDYVYLGADGSAGGILVG